VEFDHFYSSMLEPLRRYLARVLGCRTEAQDVAQSAFLRVHSAMGLRQVHQPRQFLFTTARRLAIDELRRRRRRPVDHLSISGLNATLSPSPPIDTIVAAREELLRFEEALRTLPPGCRQVFILSKIEHLSHREIAERLGIARSTVEKQITRAFRLLRASLDRLERRSDVPVGVVESCPDRKEP